MRNLTALIAMLLLSSFAKAGGGGGGGVLLSSLHRFDPEIVMHLGEMDGQVHFIHGTFINEKWRLQEYTYEISQLSDEPTLENALERSRIEATWSEVR